MPEHIPRIVLVGGGFGGLAAAKALKNTPARADWVRLLDSSDGRTAQLLWARQQKQTMTPVHNDSYLPAGTKDPHASDVLYIKALAAPLTVNTMPEGTLKAFANHGELGGVVSADPVTGK